MEKETAKIILEAKNERLIELWKRIAPDDYYDLRKNKSDEEIVEMVKESMRAVIEDRPTCFEMIDEKGERYIHMEYLGDENDKTNRKRARRI